MTKFKAVLGLTMLFLGGLTVIGLTMWLAWQIWLDMTIGWVIR